ncbi:MAG: SMC-Scp complex subunit ScpB [Bdellovibrionia bacterium]
MTKKKSKEKKHNALSSIVTWVGDPSQLNKRRTDDDVLTDEEFAAEPDNESKITFDAKIEQEQEQEQEQENEDETHVDTSDEIEADTDDDSDLDLDDESSSGTDAESESDIESEPDSDTDDEETQNEDLALESTDSKESEGTAEDDTIDALNEQLDRISKLLHSQTELNQQEDLASQGPSFDPERELALQIAEDMALEQSQALDKQNQQMKSAISFETDETPLDLAEIQSCIEALLFISDKPLSTAKLKELLAPELDRELFQDAVLGLCQKYQQVAHGIEIIEIAGGFQFRTKPGRASLAQKLAKVQTQRLSGGSMETLAIIAYRQPAMKEDIDKVRGVDSSYFIRGLMEKKLIKISGRSELPGRPVLYNTTQEFLELFGLRDLASLPSLRELEQMIPNSQSANPEDEDPRIRTMRRLVGEMNVDGLGALKYDPKEDEKLLKEFRERITAIPSSTPYLDEMKAAELLAKQQLALQQQEQGQGISQPPIEE